jgi:hypothetical protein
MSDLNKIKQIYVKLKHKAQMYYILFEITRKHIPKITLKENSCKRDNVKNQVQTENFPGCFHSTVQVL